MDIDIKEMAIMLRRFMRLRKPSVASRKIIANIKLVLEKDKTNEINIKGKKIKRGKNLGNNDSIGNFFWINASIITNVDKVPIVPAFLRIV
jgi:hypothetical protein